MFNGVAPIQQASAVPYRKRDGRVEFCLITTSRRKRWGFPKGIIDPGETPRETALKEALEEAGLHGRLERRPLGSYQYRKWGTLLSVTCFLMEVTAADENWPEADARGRRWHSVEEARKVIDRDPLLELLDGAIQRVGGA